MPHRDLVAIGASAGGIEALQQICKGLPADLEAAVLVVVHTSPQSGNLIARILARAGPLPACYPKDGERIEKGNIYVAPADYHMLVVDHHLRLVKGPKENRHRPAIDTLFRSAAKSFRNRTIGVVLTGSLDDGTSGLMVICAHGGEALVQDPETALFPSMPENALKRVPDAKVVRLEDLPEAIEELVAEPLPAASGDTGYAKQAKKSEYLMPELEEIHSGKPSQFSCPECGGVLWEIDQEGFLRYRCRVGHAYTAMNLDVEQRQSVETALWAALRALEESVSLYKRLAERARDSGHQTTFNIFLDRAANEEQNVKNLREYLTHVSQTVVELGEVPGAA